MGLSEAELAIGSGGGFVPACMTSLSGSALTALRALVLRESMLAAVPVFELSF